MSGVGLADRQSGLAQGSGSQVRTPGPGAVVNDAAVLDVTTGLAQSQRGLVTQPGGEGQDTLEVGEVVRDAVRDAKRSCALAALLNQLRETRQRAGLQTGTPGLRVAG